MNTRGIEVTAPPAEAGGFQGQVPVLAAPRTKLKGGKGDNMNKKKTKIDVRVGSNWHTLNKDMKGFSKKETVVKVTPRTFTLRNNSTNEERKVWRYASN